MESRLGGRRETAYVGGVAVGGGREGGKQRGVCVERRAGLGCPSKVSTASFTSLRVVGCECIAVFPPCDSIFLVGRAVAHRDIAVSNDNTSQTNSRNNRRQRKQCSDPLPHLVLRHPHRHDDDPDSPTDPRDDCHCEREAQDICRGGECHERGSTGTHTHTHLT